MPLTMGNRLPLSGQIKAPTTQHTTAYQYQGSIDGYAGPYKQPLDDGLCGAALPVQVTEAPNCI